LQNNVQEDTFKIVPNRTKPVVKTNDILETITLTCVCFSPSSTCM
jgi:hypothetical protein